MSGDVLLRNLIQESASAGWAVGLMQGPFHGRGADYANLRLLSQARALDLLPVSNRTGDTAIAELRPTLQAEARPASLSAQVGLAQQPLHTDGAHLRLMPDYVLLWCAEPSQTPTRVWNPLQALRKVDTAGIFLVEPGSEPFLAQAGTHGSLRFDPGCMTPADGHARTMCETLLNPPEGEVQEVHWDTPGKVALLRNRNVLHGRAHVAAGDEDRGVFRLALRRALR